MTLRFRPHFFLYHLLWNMLYTWMMNSSFFILSLQFPIKEILCSLQTSPVLITQSHRAKGWGSPHQGPSATFCHELVLGPSAVLFAGGGCVYYFCLGMTAGMESWGSWTELGCCLAAWSMGRACPCPLAIFHIMSKVGREAPLPGPRTEKLKDSGHLGTSPKRITES